MQELLKIEILFNPLCIKQKNNGAPELLLKDSYNSRYMFLSKIQDINENH